jgi:hypothetical protein
MKEGTGAIEERVKRDFHKYFRYNKWNPGNRAEKFDCGDNGDVEGKKKKSPWRMLGKGL